MFTKPLAEVQIEYANIQKEIVKKNKDIKALFSSKYTELLNCSDLLNGIGDYTKQIITLTNQTQLALAAITESSPPPPLHPQHDAQPTRFKHLSYLIKKLKIAHTQGRTFHVLLMLLHLLRDPEISDHEKLYPRTFLAHLRRSFDIDNIIDCFFCHVDNLPAVFSQLVAYGARNCDNYQRVRTLLDQLQNFSGYRQKIYEFYLKKWTFQELYEKVTNLNPQDEPIPVDTSDQEQAVASLLHPYLRDIHVSIQNQLLSNLVLDGEFSYDLYAQIQTCNIEISQEMRMQAKRQWTSWFGKRIETLYATCAQIIFRQPIERQQDFISIFQEAQALFKPLGELLDKVEKLKIGEIDYDIETCSTAITAQHEIFSNRLQQQVAEITTFECFYYYQLLILHWNKSLPQRPIASVEQSQARWNLQEIDSVLPTIYQLQKIEIQHSDLIALLRLLLGGVEIQFSMKYRNLATALHPEKAEEFYKAIFSKGGFNNKQLKRCKIVNSQEPIYEQYLKYYHILQPQQQASLQSDAWTKQQSVKQELQSQTQQQAQSQQKSLFGIRGFMRPK